ncbi:hypothetical protein [Stenotrophomonas maltophilia]|uniref:hypothetical protein n=1 Tax=Stenotrophomonas maltophilia TaxID=40324 RepID=UPI001678A00E|nr:hypothetical protein [Stenotrophomonas maltophilia]
MSWLYAIGLKLLIAPLFVLAYWLLAIKGGNALVRWLIPSQKWRDFLTKDRYF